MLTTDRPDDVSRQPRRERLVAELCELVLRTSGEPIAERDVPATFVELGFDSLLLTQIAQQVSAKFGVSLKLRRLLEDLSSVGALAEHLDATLPVDEGEPTERLLHPPLANQRDTLVPAGFAAHVVGRQLGVMARQLEILTAIGDASSSVVVSALSSAIERTRDALALDAGPSERARAPESAPLSIGRRFAVFSSRERAAALTAEQERYVASLVERYVEKTRSSKAFTQKNRAHLADPRAARGFSRELKEVTYPIVASRSSGCRFWDLDGNEYVDLVSAHGESFFGYSPAFLKEALLTQLDRGVETGSQHPLVEDVSGLFCDATGMERVFFCSTGAEAMQGAIRAARAVTGRQGLVVFDGAYHGAFDEVVVRRGRGSRAIPAAIGVARSAIENVSILSQGDPAALDTIRARHRDIAAVLVEPLQGLQHELGSFVRDLRALTTEVGVALVFDETMTGFRCAPGGAQEKFGVKADLAAYGGALGGGLPIGAIAGRRAYMDVFDGGNWQYGDDSMPEAGVTYFVGSLARHPLGLAAAKAVLEHLRALGASAHEVMDARAERFATAMNAWFERTGAPLVVHRFSSVVGIEFTVHTPFRDLLFLLLRDKGVHAIDHRPSFFTCAHTDSDVDFVVERFQESVTELTQSGFLRRDSPAALARPPLPGARLGRDSNGNPAWFVPDPSRPGMFQQVELSS